MLTLSSLRTKVLGLVAGSLGLSACTPPPELEGDALGPTLEMNELMGLPDGDETVPLPSDARSSLPKTPFAATGLPRVSEEHFALLPEALRAKPRLAKLALTRALENPIDYQGGAYGLVGPAKVFVATRDLIKDDARLYWVMVKVLSEKYGCFMVSKTNIGDQTRVKCRDKRNIVFWRSRGDGWIQFLARQYDVAGYEIVVRKRKIVRISREVALDVL